MARIGLLCPPIAGHLNPIAALGRTLARRGHRAAAFQIPEARHTIERQQLEFVPIGDAAHDTRAIADAVARLGTLSGIRAVKFTVQCAASLARTTCQYAPAAISKAGVDLLVVDQNEPAGACVAQRLQLPFINVLSGLPLNRDVSVPPPFVSWAYRDGVPSTLINAAAYAVFDRLVAPINNVLNEYRRGWGLPPIRRPDDTFSRLAQLSQLTEDFDFPRAIRPVELHYLGPLRDNEAPAIPFPFDRLNGKPLVFASFGTLQNGRDEMFHIVADACASLDVQLVISRGGGPAGTTNLRGTPIVVGMAPQLQLLERASVCITHGGMNTVMDSLSRGVPMVAVPVTNDHPGVCARLRHSGAGEVVSPMRFSATRLRHALRRVLELPDYRRKAQMLKASIERAGGVERAADIVEAIAGRR